MTRSSQTRSAGDALADTLPGKQRSRSIIRSPYMAIVMAASAALLPTLSLAVLGSVWLWQNGYLLAWAGAAMAVSIAIYGFEWIALRRTERRSEPPGPSAGDADAESNAGSSADGTGSSREQAAQRAVDDLLARVTDKDLASRDGALNLAKRTVDVVAREMHPGQKDPSLKFTLPEAFALTERVSGRLKRIVRKRVPLGDRLTVGQAMSIYRWRGLIGVAERAYDLWRIVRLANPATAAAGELRERISGQLLRGVQSEVMRRLAKVYVREIAAAAIDLYSGRLRPEADRSSDDPTSGKAIAIDEIGTSDESPRPLGDD
jgi:hypothetical protein